MRVRFHDNDGTTYEIDAPEQTTIRYRSHRRGPSGDFLDDVVIVPWKGKAIGLEGKVVVQAAQRKILGLRLVRQIKADAAQSGLPRH